MHIQGVRKVLAKAAFLSLLAASVPAGIAAAVFAFFAAAYIVSSIAALAFSGALALVLLTGGMSALASRGLFRRGRAARRWLPASVAAGTLILVGLAAAGLVFEPMDVRYVPMEPTEETRYWKLPTGSRIAYSVTPADEATSSAPVVMLHGGPGAPGGSLFPGQTERRLAAAGFDVYNYHQVGAGLSSRLEDASQYTVGRHLTDLEAIRQKIGAERLKLVGGSWGGTLGAHYIAAHPDRVEKAVFASPGAIWSPVWADWGEDEGSDGLAVDIITEAATPRFGVVYQLQRINPRAAQNLASDQEMSGFMQPLIAQIIAQDVAGCGEDHENAATPGEPIIPTGFGFYANMVTAGSVERTDDPRPALQESDIPVLILRGECDRIPWHVSLEYREVFRNSQLIVVEGSAHDVAGSPLYPALLEAFFLGEKLPVEPYSGR